MQTLTGRTPNLKLSVIICVVAFATGYGVSTTSAPANGNDTDWVMWIVVACAGLAFLIIALVIVLLSYRSKKPRCLWEPKPIVQEETPEGVNGKSASTLQAPLLINRQV